MQFMVIMLTFEILPKQVFANEFVHSHYVIN